LPKQSPYKRQRDCGSGERCSAQRTGLLRNCHDERSVAVSIHGGDLRLRLAMTVSSGKKSAGVVELLAMTSIQDFEKAMM